jgi:hypothetical protein
MDDVPSAAIFTNAYLFAGLAGQGTSGFEALFAFVFLYLVQIVVYLCHR